MTQGRQGTLCVAIVMLLSLQGCLSANTAADMDDDEREQGYFLSTTQTPTNVSSTTTGNGDITHIPESVTPSSNAPSSLSSMDGQGLPSRRGLTEVTLLADEVGAIVVHAEGIIVDNTTLDMGGNEEAWNAGYCCGDALYHETTMWITSARSSPKR